MTTTQGTALVDIRAKLKAELEAQRERVAPPTGNRISTQGKIFKLPDGKSTPGPISLIVLDWRIVHQYYTGAYDPAKRAAPTCWAIGPNLDIAPDKSKVANPKSESCAGCPFNEFGSAATGRGKACKEGRRLAVIPPDAGADTVPYILDVPPTGIAGFEAYITALRGYGRHPMEVITEVGFNDAHYPVPVFHTTQQASDEQVAIAFQLSQSLAAAALDRDPT